MLYASQSPKPNIAGGVDLKSPESEYVVYIIACIVCIRVYNSMYI